MISDLPAAQADMRAGYASGAGGIVASAAAWLAAAIVTQQMGAQQGVWALYIGGMLIHPAGMLVSKVLTGRAGHAKDNPLGGLAMATTFWLIFSLPLAYAAYLQNAEWFFPAMLLIIGGRYLTFAHVYGMRLYWTLGFVLAGAAIGLAYAKIIPVYAAFAGAAIEAVFAAVALGLHGRWQKSQTA